jgi:DNA polymerase/3'-5' exonuclease PolX
MHISQALPTANHVVDLLKPHCTKIDIAGSIRREKAEVKDIEIVCLPRVETAKDLFGAEEVVGRSTYFTYAVFSIAKFIHKGVPAGKYMQIETHQGIMLDLFMASDFDYYRTLAIRTGSAEYAAVIIAAGWRKIGWCGSDKGLRKISDCIEVKDDQGKHKSWKCINPTAELPPHWNSEDEFFSWINVPYRSPKNREIGSSLYNEAL